MAVIILPVSGAVLYALFGSTLYSRWRFGRKAQKDRDRLSQCPYEHQPSDAGDGGTDYMLGGNDVKMLSPDDAVQSITDDILSADIRIMAELRHMPDWLCDALELRAGSADVLVVAGSRGIMTSRRLRDCGAKVRSFHNPLYMLVSTRMRCRDFREVIVIDDRVAYILGRNAIRVEGPTVDRLLRRCCADWLHAGGDDCKISSVSDSKGDAEVMVVASGPDAGRMLPVASQYHGIISSTKHTLRIMCQYLVPDESIYNVIKLAVLSGVEVQIVVPASADHWYQPWNTLSAANPLMMAGVKVYMSPYAIEDNILISDSRQVMWSSSPFATPSMVHDFHLSLVINSNDVASDAQAIIDAAMADAVECPQELYAGRTFQDRMRIAVARLMMFRN